MTASRKAPPIPKRTAPLAWTPELLTGNAQIDEQHKRIFQILDSLLLAINENQEREEIGKVLATLSMFVVAHFRMEEAIMVQHGFKGLAAHTKAHAAVRMKVESMVDSFHNDLLDPKKLLTFMEWWLEEHVRLEDQPLSTFLMALESSGPAPMGDIPARER